MTQAAAAPPPLSIVAVSGNTRRPSRTAALVSAVLQETVIQVRAAGFAEPRTTFLELAAIAPDIMGALQSDQLLPQGEAIVHAIEKADLLIVGSPVYRASYTGALKHLFDLVGWESLKGKAGLVAATGGSPLHGLVMEHQFKPLLGFFRMIVAPTPVYALDSDFDNYALTSGAVRDRIAVAAGELVRLASWQALPARQAQAA